MLLQALPDFTLLPLFAAARSSRKRLRSGSFCRMLAAFHT
jgi:hypothetical protein